AATQGPRESTGRFKQLHDWIKAHTKEGVRKRSVSETTKNTRVVSDGSVNESGERSPLAGEDVIARVRGGRFEKIISRLPAAAPDESISAEAERQRRTIEIENRISEPLEDGVRVSTRIGALDINGVPHKSARSYSEHGDFNVVVDLTNDPTIRNAVKEVGENPHLSQLSADKPWSDKHSELVAYLSDVASYVRGAMEPVGVPSKEQQEWYQQLTKQWTGEQVLLGQFVDQKMGICNQQALMAKVLLDYTIGGIPGAEVSFERGDRVVLNEHGQELREPHAWVRVRVPEGNGFRDIIVDPRRMTPLSESKLESTSTEPVSAKYPRYDIEPSAEKASTQASESLREGMQMPQARLVVGGEHGTASDAGTSGQESVALDSSLLAQGNANYSAALGLRLHVEQDSREPVRVESNALAEHRVDHEPPVEHDGPKESDESGRPIGDGNLKRVAAQFEPLHDSERRAARAELERDMSEYKGSGGKNILQQLSATESLTPSQREMILSVLTEVRERYMSVRDSKGAISPEQRGSYIHTIGELSETLDSAKANGLSGQETMNAVLAAMLSDSSKAGWTRESGGNFFTHHLDGALAAEVVLKRYLNDNFTQQDLAAITHAILEHQIGPPSFMAFAYTSQIRSQINEQAHKRLSGLLEQEGEGKLTTEERSELQRLKDLKTDYEKRDLAIKGLEESRAATPDDSSLSEKINALRARQKEGVFVTDAEVAALARIHKMISNPFASETEPDSMGGVRLKFDNLERSLLYKYIGHGTQNWHVPDATNSWDRISRVVISADSFDNYYPRAENGVPVKGPFKIAGLRGPLSVTPDNHIDAAIASLKDSEQSTLKQGLLTPADVERAKVRMQDDDMIYSDAKSRTEAWIREQLHLAPDAPLPDVPYWNSKLELPGASASPEEKAAFAVRPEVQFADRIQKEFTNELLRMRRFGDDVPQSFESVRGDGKALLNHRAEAAQKDAALLAFQQFIDANVLSDRAWSEIGKSLDQFNERARLTDMNAETFRQCLERVRNILEPNEHSAIHLRVRQSLAEEALWLLANPTFTAQGTHSTCGPASIEARHYQIDPANALKVVEDIAIRGEYVCPDGTVLQPFTYGGKFEFTRDKDAMTMWREGMPHELEDEVSTTRGGRRLAVSQIFQSSVLAAVYHNEDFYEGEKVGVGNLGVLSDQVIDPSQPAALRDVMVDMSKNPPVPLRNMKGQMKEFMGLHNGDLLSAYKKMFGKDDLTIIQKGGVRSGLPGEQFFTSEEEFFDIIQKSKFPAILNFDTVSSDRFWQGGHGGGHYIGIVDKVALGQHIGEPSPETTGLRIDNQWQPDGQMVIPLTELATMSFSRWDIKRQSMVKDRIASHPDDIEAKLELVRLQLETERQRRNNEKRCAELQAQGKPIPKVIQEFQQTVKPDEHCISADEARKLIFELKSDALMRNRRGMLDVDKESQLWDGSSLADALAGHEDLRLRRFINQANKVLERTKLVEDSSSSSIPSAQESESSAHLLSRTHANSDESVPNGAHETTDEQTHEPRSVHEAPKDDSDPFERFASLLASVSSSHHEADDAHEDPKVNYTESGTVREQLGLEPVSKHEQEERSDADAHQQGTHEQDFNERLNQFLQNEEIAENIRRSLSQMKPPEQERFLNFIEGRSNLEAAYQEHARLEALRRERLFPSLDAVDGGRSYPGKWTFPDLAELGETGLENLLKHRLNDFKNHPFNDLTTMERFHDHVASVLPRWLPEVNVRMIRLKTELTPLENESQTVEKRLTELHDEMLKSDLAQKQGTQRFSTEKLAALQEETVRLTDRLAVLDKQTDPLRSELAPLVERRRQMLEESLNAFALEQGLPAVRLRVDRPLPDDATATYDSGTGNIFLRESDLCDPRRIDIGTMYHELLHGEQDAAVLRNAMLDAWRATGGKGDLDEFYAFGRTQVFKFYKEALNRRFDDVQLSPERFSEVFPVAQDANKLREYEEFMSSLRSANPGNTSLTNALANLPAEKQLRYRELYHVAQMQALHDRQIAWIKERGSLSDESLIADPEYARARHLAESLKPERALNPELERFSEISKLISDLNHDFAPHEFIERLISDPAYQEKLFGYQLLDDKFADSTFQELLFTKQNFAQKVLTYKFEQWSQMLPEDERPRFSKARIRLMLKALVFMYGDDSAGGREFDNPRTIEMTKKLLTEALHDAGDGESRRKWKDYLSNNWEFEANLAGHRLNQLFDDRIAKQSQSRYPETGTRDYYANLIERYQENKNPLIDGMSPQQLITEYERVLHEKYELDRVAKLDDMTGLPNKAGIREHLEHEIKVVERKGSTDKSVSFLMMDFDGFKPVNDNLGHDFGDKTIKAFGEFLKTKLRTSDIAGRFGGDEFVAILPNTSDPAPIADIIRQTRLQVSTNGVKVLEPNEIPERGADVFVVGVSVGSATWGKDPIDPTKETSRAEQLIKIADDRQLTDKNERKALARQGLNPHGKSDLSGALDEALHSHVRVRDAVGRSMPSKELSADLKDVDALREVVKRGRAKNNELIQTLIHDPLTGLYNKAEIERCLHRTVKRYERLAYANEEAGLPPPKLKQMMMDVDGLKPINDTFGHIGGDLLLRTLAARMQGYVLNERGELVKTTSETVAEGAPKVTGFRDTDVLARLGGDEFMAILPDCEDVTRLAKELQDYRVAVGKKDDQVYIRELKPGEQIQAGELMSGISIGYSDWFPGRSAKELETISDHELNRNKELREELGLRIPRPKEVDKSGRALDKKNPIRIADQFKPLTELETQVARAELQRDMREYKGADGKSVLDQVNDNENLSRHQKDMILNVLAEVRERYMSIREKDGAINPDQRGSYLHTIGELSETLDSAKANGLDGRETQNAALAAMLSDSSKGGWSPETGGNFFTHHLDGALAAEVVLSRYIDSNFTNEDLNDVTHAILEHQIGPPRFMADRYTELIRSGLSKRKEELYTRLEPMRGQLPLYLERELERLTKLKNEYEWRENLIDTTLKRINAGEPVYGIDLKTLQSKQREGKFVSDEEASSIENIRKMMADPLGSELEEDPLGGYRLKFSAQERSLLARYVDAGTENWHVPNATNSWDKISRVVISADSFDNYFPKVENGEPVKGPFKIAALRGPDKFPPDNCLDSAIAALKESETNTLQQKLLTPADEARAVERMKDDQIVYARARAGTEKWLRETLGLTEDQEMPNVPYWNSKLDLPRPSAPQSEKDEFFARPEVKLAIEIQRRFAGELLAMRRFDHSQPTDFSSVRDKSEDELEQRKLDAAN
ncbi:MAG TPA: GGDEF domain-containing protein, partial [Oculatellaceae cyanobacterium]